MSSSPQLPASAEYVDETSESHEEIRRLNEQVRRLKSENESLRSELAVEKQVARETEVPMRNLRRQLQPLYRALQGVFGELDAANGLAEGGDTDQPIPETKYMAWKQRLSPACGKIIDALLVQPLTHSQMVTYCKMHFDTIGKALKTMRANQLLEQDGKVYRLKP